ncbi:MAG: L-asparaginase, partial [Candidatus Electrothrix sp. AR3]|nr:L-asparaginase [Candidatus Electrothrix sp. AR3]
PGCGLFCGPEGAVACTGDGEFIALKILAREIYGWLQEKMSADEAVEKALTLFDDSVDIGLIIVTQNDFAANARNGMAWSHRTEMRN